MRQRIKKWTALLAAAALCLAAPVGALADGPSLLYTFAEEYQDALSEPMEITTFDGDDTAVQATVSTEDDKTTVTETGYYTVTIPATVSVDSAETAASFAISGTLEKYRKLTIEVSTANAENSKDYLKCGNEKLPYTLSATSSDDSLTIDNHKKYSAESDAAEKTFSANFSVQLDETATPTVSGEYTDTLTFTMACQKKTYTVVYDGNDADSGETMQSSIFNCGESATLAENQYTKTNYHFAGWSIEKNPATFDNLYADKAKVEEALASTDGATVTLYAQWGHEYTVKIHYEDVNGKFQDEDVVTYSKVLKEGTTFEWKQASKDVWGDLTEAEYNKRWQTAVKDATATTKEEISTITEEVGTADKTFDVYVLRQQYRVDLNGYAIDDAGNRTGGANIDGFAIADVWVNDERVSGEDGVIDYFAWQRYGSTFRVELREGSIAQGYTVDYVEYTTSETINGTTYGILKGSHWKSDSKEPYWYDSVTFVFKKSSTTGTDSTETTAEQSLTITDTMRDYFADFYPADETADDPASEDTDPAEDTETAPEDPEESTQDDGYDAYDEYVVDDYPVVFFDTDR